MQSAAREQMEKASDVGRNLWRATLDKTSPRYQAWLKLLGTNDVPLVSCMEHNGRFPGYGTVACYAIDVGKLTNEQIERYVAHFAARFNVAHEEVRREILGEHGIPIWTEDVSIAISRRAFI
jgi:hypothetical protein